MPKMPSGCPPYQEICVELEQYLKPCDCGGVFTSVVRAKAAIRGHFKTGHMEWPGT
jgi:hypothetical protein